MNIEECSYDDEDIIFDEIFKAGAVCVLEENEQEKKICILCKK